MQKTYDVTLELITPMLGTAPKDKEIYATYIASKGSENGDELETSPDSVEEKGWTGFHSLNGSIGLYDYMIKGFMKDACSMLRRDSDSKSAKLTAFKKIVDGLVFIEPRFIPIVLSGSCGVVERPLRAQTAQGERVTLARSDSVPAGSQISFRLTVIGKDPTRPTLDEWFGYGQWRGLGQWRNGSYGRFKVVQMEAVEDSA